MRAYGSCKKSDFFLVARPLRGGGVKDGPQEKVTSFEAYFLLKKDQKVPLALSLRGVRT